LDLGSTYPSVLSGKCLESSSEAIGCLVKGLPDGMQNQYLGHQYLDNLASYVEQICNIVSISTRNPCKTQGTGAA